MSRTIQEWLDLLPHHSLPAATNLLEGIQHGLKNLERIIAFAKQYHMDATIFENPQDHTLDTMVQSLTDLRESLPEESPHFSTLDSAILPFFFARKFSIELGPYW